MDAYNAKHTVYGGNQKIRLETDPRILLPLLAFCEKNIIRYIVLVVSMIPIVNILSGFIVPCLYLLLLYTYVREYGFHSSIKEVGVIVFISSAIFFSCLLYPINATYLLDSNNFWNTIFPCLRYYIVGLIAMPNKKTMDCIGKASCVAILVETLFVIMYMMPRGLMQSDDMSRAYQILPNILFSINYALNNKEKGAWLCSIIGVIYVCSMGTRGPLVVILVYYFIKFLQQHGKTKAYTITLGVAFITAGIIFINSQFYISTLYSAKNIFSSFGLSTRIIDLAINNEVVTHTSGRDEIYDLLRQKISEQPVLGYGVYGEWQWIHWNAHNIFLEIMVHYGVILGSILLLWIAYTIINSYRKSTTNEARDMILIWVCFVFVRGIFGGSYLQFGIFFLVGFCLREIRRSSDLKNECNESC